MRWIYSIWQHLLTDCIKSKQDEHLNEKKIDKKAC